MSRSNITRRGNSWQLKFDLSAADGKRRTRYATVRGGTYKDAQREHTKLLNSADVGTLPDPSNATLAEYLRAWLDSSHERSPKTLERYRQLAERQIIPHLGANKLQKLKPEDVKRWHTTLLGQGLAPRTVGHAHRLLKLVLGYAVRSATLTRNVASVHAAPAVEVQEIETLTAEQITAALTKLEGHMLHPIVSLALATGIRRGEICGLQWGDLDLDRAVLRVERSVEETRAGLRLKPPKTKRGRRNVSLPAATVTILRAHKVQQMELRLALGLGKADASTPVFSDIEGRLLKPLNITHAWRYFVATSGLPKVTFHALRHTHVSTLISAGVDILTISRRLGHSKASITLDVYGHLIGGADEAAAAAMDGVLK